MRTNTTVEDGESTLAIQRGLGYEFRQLNARLRELLPANRIGRNEDPLNAFRGLVVSDQEVTDVLDALDGWVTNLQQGTLSRSLKSDNQNEIEKTDGEGDSPIAHLCHLFGLSIEHRRCLVCALAAEMDSRYERIFAFLQDDVTRKGPSVGLLLELIEARDAWRSRRMFLSDSPLMRWQLLHVYDRSTEPSSLLSKGVRVDERIVEYLLEPEFHRPCDDQREVVGPIASINDQWQAIRKVLLDFHANDSSRSIVVVISGAAGMGQRSLANWLASEIGCLLYWADAKMVLKQSGQSLLVVREAMLRGAALAVEHSEIGLGSESFSEELLQLIGLARANLRSLFIICEGPWQTPPSLLTDDLYVVELALPTSSERLLLWKESLAGLPSVDGSELPPIAARYPLAPEQIRCVANQLRQAARLGDGTTSAAQVQQTCRAHLPARVLGVSESEPQRKWQDLVLPNDVRSQLEEICGQARQRGKVLGHWGFDAKLSGGKGLQALFSGPPGTGKTLAAEVIAGALGRRLWRVDLAQLVSKYIGETEKNIDRIFRAAWSENVLLFFDEADALFGRRSEVKDAHDRYANQEVSYLLQQMEEYEGVAVLATNLARNLDEAFLRRLQFVVDFPVPDEEQRRLIWDVVFPAAAPLCHTVDLAALSRIVRLSGGHIRNIALSAAYLAADQGTPIGMSQLWHAAQREYHKIGQSWTPPST